MLETLARVHGGDSNVHSNVLEGVLEVQDRGHRGMAAYENVSCHTHVHGCACVCVCDHV